MKSGGEAGVQGGGRGGGFALLLTGDAVPTLYWSIVIMLLPFPHVLSMSC
jgi:hypothetical protein